MGAPGAHSLRSHRQADAGQQRHDERRQLGQKELSVVVHVRGVSHRFASRRPSSFFRLSYVQALSSFSLAVEAGEFVALTGRNGAGKTTVLEILATLLIPTTGEVTVCGFDARTDGPRVREHVAYCPAGGGSFWPRLTGYENLQFFTALAGLDVDADAARRVAGDVGLDADVLDREVRTYSDGQAQRLSLARALLRDARVWLIDEPTRSLDPEGQDAMWTLIHDRAEARQATVIAATHDLRGVERVADRTVALP